MVDGHRSLALFLLSALGVAACVPKGTTAKAPVGQRAVASTLTVALDEKQVEAQPDGGRIAGRGATPFKIVAIAPVERHPVPGETAIAVLTSGERVVKQAPFVFDALRGRAKLEVPGPGNYRIEMWVGNQFVVGNTFVAASLPTLDGQRALELHQDASPQLVLGTSQDQITGKLRWNHWDSIESDEAFLAEWWRDGRKIATARSDRSKLQKEVLLKVQTYADADAFMDEPVWKFVTEQFDAPEQLTSAVGHWELRVYREEHPALSLSFDVTPNGEIQGAARRTITQGRVELEVSAAKDSKEATKALSKIPRNKFEGSKKLFLPVTVAEVRALTRSSVLRTMRARLNSLQRQAGIGNAEGLNSFAEESPSAAEAKKLVPQMQKLIGQIGEPWTEAERP